MTEPFLNPSAAFCLMPVKCAKALTMTLSRATIRPPLRTCSRTQRAFAMLSKRSLRRVECAALQSGARRFIHGLAVRHVSVGAQASGRRLTVRSVHAPALPFSRSARMRRIRSCVSAPLSHNVPVENALSPRRSPRILLRAIRGYGVLSRLRRF